MAGGGRGGGDLQTQVSMGEMSGGVWKGREGAKEPPAGLATSGEWSAELSPHLPQWVPRSLVVYSEAMRALGAEAWAHPASARNSSTETSPLHPSPRCCLPGLSPARCQREMESTEGAGIHRGARRWGLGGGCSLPLKPAILQPPSICCLFLTPTRENTQ